MRQLTYLSSAAPCFGGDDLHKILAKARLNNRQYAVTGLLLFDGAQFLQALEGDAPDVAIVFARVMADPRHHTVVILVDREVVSREFGDWAMAANLAQGSGGCLRL